MRELLTEADKRKIRKLAMPRKGKPDRTQREIALLTGWSQPTVHNVLSGKADGQRAA